MGVYILSVGKECVILAAEKKSPSILIDPESLSKISLVGPSLGIVYSGLGPDSRVLVIRARKFVQSYWQVYRIWPSASQLVRELASIMQEFTHQG
jgi:20S proteasome subunit alpha 2